MVLSVLFTIAKIMVRVETCKFFLTTEGTESTEGLFFINELNEGNENGLEIRQKNIPQGVGAYFYELNEYRKR